MSLLPWCARSNIPMRISARLLASLGLPIKIIVDNNVARSSQCVISLHEVVDSVATCLEIGEGLSLKRIVLLQLPPFYGDKKRLKNIEEAYRLWTRVINPNLFFGEAWLLLRKNIEQEESRNIRRMLNKFDLILAVSKSIPIEMGGEWIHKIVSLNQGVALPQHDLQIIKVSERCWEKENTVVFGGRPTFEKGIIEGLIAWRSILKNISRNYRLIITGEIRPSALARLKRFCRKLGIENNVLFTGFVSREERLSIVAKAKMMMYPSHVDAFPYAVLEALNLNTPVVAYDIPALRIYYGDLEGVTLVKEGDIEALIQNSMEIVNSKHIYVEKPKLTKSLNEIMDEETKIIKETLLRK
ncbi:MAG: glycosyltransferase [Candidatus Bathyarchaeia archaeon]